MTGTKRKIKAKLFVSDVRNGIGDRELMERHTLSESQLHKVFRKLVDAGAIDEMELFMRTSLSDSTVSKAFVETQSAVKELQNVREITPPRYSETPPEIEITEKVNTYGKVLGRILFTLAGAGS
ncbi:MAG TPA: hypothetical protein VMC85_23630 [Desulfomonilaceae bacterium]|nr:hypothetical protein [Desulfomonilaceae bacterium]